MGVRPHDGLCTNGTSCETASVPLDLFFFISPFRRWRCPIVFPHVRPSIAVRGFPQRLRFRGQQVSAPRIVMRIIDSLNFRRPMDDRPSGVLLLYSPGSHILELPFDFNGPNDCRCANFEHCYYKAYRS